MYLTGVPWDIYFRNHFKYIYVFIDSKTLHQFVHLQGTIAPLVVTEQIYVNPVIQEDIMKRRRIQKV